MPRLKTECSLCGKTLIETFHVTLSDIEVLQEYKCGHSFVRLKADVKDHSIAVRSVDGSGKEARAYQTSGVKFIVDPPDGNFPFNAIIGDQMRLGKTPQALLALQSYYKERTPCLILVKSANLWQWIKEYKVWTDILPLGIYPIVGSKTFIPPGFSSYILSMDTFSRAGMVEKLLAFGFKLVIVDEAHNFKNTSSARAKALVQFLHDIQETNITKNLSFMCPLCKHVWEEKIEIKINLKYTTKTSTFHHQTKCPNCSTEIAQTCRKLDNVERTHCGIIMLSGTFVKNRADEYFVPLNIVAPERFPYIETYRRQWLLQDDKGKWSFVNPKRWEAFQEYIRPFVLRREKEDVFTELPKLDRTFTIITVEDQRLKDAYNNVLTQLEAEMVTNPSYSMFQSIGQLNQLRQICGLAKVKWAADYAETMLMDSDKAKLAIGIHHHSIRDHLARELDNFGVLKLSGQDSAEEKYRIMTHFENSRERILILNILAGGVGMDFHYVDNVLVLERQWSAADEEQFEFRFYNPDLKIKNRSTTIEYILAKGTIDEFFYNMVEEKRVIMGQTIGTNWDITKDTTSWKSLLEETVSYRL